VTPEDARVFGIRARWQYLQAICRVVIGEEPSGDRLEEVLGGFEVQHDPAVTQQAASRLEALKVSQVDTRVSSKAKPRASSRAKTHASSRQPSDRASADHKLSKEQKKYVSPKSFFETRISGLRDLIFQILSKHPEGLSEEDMEEEVRNLLERDGFDVPGDWDLLRLLRVVLNNQTHHFQQHESEDGWIATKLPARELSTRYLNSLRVQRCSSVLDPMDCPALLHIYVQRWSGAMTTPAYLEIDARYQAMSKAVDAAFGRKAQQPETSAWSEGTHQYPMKINCVLPSVRATESLHDMFALHPSVMAALAELEEYAQANALQNLRCGGSPVAYRVIIMGLDGGSVNNDSFREMVEAFPHLEGQLLVCNDQASIDSTHCMVLSEPMVDWMRPACLLRGHEGEDETHNHVMWGFLKFSTLADEWSPSGDDAFAPSLAGDVYERFKREQQRLASRKLLLSNTLMFYYRKDQSIAGTRATAEFADPAVIRSQTHNGMLAEGPGNSRNNCVTDRCTPESEPFARVCRWCGDDETTAFWAHSIKLPQEDEPILGFVCDSRACYLLEMQEGERAREAHRLPTAVSKPEQSSSDSSDSSDSSSDDRGLVERGPEVPEQDKRSRVVVLRFLKRKGKGFLGTLGHAQDNQDQIMTDAPPPKKKSRPFGARSRKNTKNTKTSDAPTLLRTPREIASHIGVWIRDGEYKMLDEAPLTGEANTAFLAQFEGTPWCTWPEVKFIQELVTRATNGQAACLWGRVNKSEKARSKELRQSACSTCVEKRRFCISKLHNHFGMKPVLLPLPEDQRKGMSRDDVGYWRLEDTVME
jgi:hypothetical protein